MAAVPVLQCPEVMGQVARAGGPAVGVGEDEALGSLDTRCLALLLAVHSEDRDGGAVQGEGAGAGGTLGWQQHRVPEAFGDRSGRCVAVPVPRPAGTTNPFDTDRGSQIR